MKPILFQHYREALEETLQELQRGVDAARSGTRVDGTHRPENRGERGAVSAQGYLALGLSQRIEDIRRTLQLLDRIPPSPRDRAVVGALITLERDHEKRLFLILPGGGGISLASSPPVTVLSPNSPLARRLSALEVDDELSLTATDPDPWVILRIE